MTKQKKLLASWNKTATRKAIVNFVEAVTDKDSPSYVPPEERIAVFDNDGTLWAEKPMPIQLDFTLHRLGPRRPPTQLFATNNRGRPATKRTPRGSAKRWSSTITADDGDMGLLMKAIPSAFADLTVDQYSAEVTEFFRTATNTKLGRPYRKCGYAPMVELLRFLEANGFVVYIASGGDRDFMRPVAGDLYGIPPERIIGSSFALDYRESDDGRDVLYKSEIEFFDDGPTKPVRIWSRIGRRPILAGGNSNGDVPMMRFAHTTKRPGLRLLLLHDDAEREFDYTAGAEDALKDAKDSGWTVISIKNDWSTVFAS
jgi:phosphoserine phosphatase